MNQLKQTRTGQPQGHHRPTETKSEQGSTAFFEASDLQFFQAADANVAYRKFGEGPPLLLIHGWPLTGFTWRKVLPGLARHFTCYVPDLAGLGDTTWDKGTDFRFSAQAARLEALANHLGLQSYAVLAQNTGATIARLLSLSDRRISKMILLNTEIPQHRLPWIPLYRRLFYIPGSFLFFQLLMRSTAFLRSPMGFGGAFLDLDLLDDDFQRHFIRPCLQSTRRVKGVQKYLIGLDYSQVDAFREQHKQINAPVMFIWGADDPTFPEAEARPMATQFEPPAAFVSIPGAKLMVHEERPDEVVRAALDFLARTD